MARMLRAGIIVLFFVHLLFSDRAVVSMNTGGRGLLPVLDFVMLALVCAMLIVDRTEVSEAYWNTEFLVFWLPFLALGILFPILGVMIGWYEPRSVLTTFDPLLGFASVAVGYQAAIRQPSSNKLLQRMLFWSIVFETFYATLLYLQKQSLIQVEILDSLAQWDISSQSSYDEAYVVAGRGVGTFINPNDLALWAAISYWAAYALLRGHPRAVAMICCVLSLLISQSRGSLFAWLVSVLAWPGLRFLHNMRIRNPTTTSRSRFDQFRLILYMLIIVALVAASVLMFGDAVDAITSRIGKGAMALTEGSDADESLVGRQRAWENAFDFFEEYPLGTFGSPELLFGGFIDNGLIRILLQGGVIYLLAYTLTAAGGLRQYQGKTPEASFLACCTIVLLGNSMTSLVMTSSSITLYWLFVGLHLGAIKRRSLVSGVPPTKRTTGPQYSIDNAP